MGCWPPLDGSFFCPKWSDDIQREEAQGAVFEAGKKSVDLPGFALAMDGLKAGWSASHLAILRRGR